MERYKIAKYSQWQWGIIDTTLNNNKGLYLRKGSEADPYKPISENNKLLLFKSKEEAQKYADDLAEEDALIESFLNKIPNAVEARWDEKRKAYIVSKEEYDRWDD